ncbi:hypothetical protein BIWAKO_05390 [Bosea sp. BIWAKO-01]|nr:hypothetical protein BIWAKO_05390 [Bosea sp. BIWAKO-01]
MDLLIMGHRDDGAAFIGYLASPTHEKARNGSNIEGPCHDNKV